MQTWNVRVTPEVMSMLLSKTPGGTRDSGQERGWKSEEK